MSSGVTTGLLIKKVNPIYPEDARAAYIEGTLVLRAEISKAGDIMDLELVDGPIELAGFAVAAVRQWKYKPYLLLGQPVIVDTPRSFRWTLYSSPGSYMDFPIVRSAPLGILSYELSPELRRNQSIP